MKTISEIHQGKRVTIRPVNGGEIEVALVTMVSGAKFYAMNHAGAVPFRKTWQNISDWEIVDCNRLSAIDPKAIALSDDIDPATGCPKTGPV